tara:strand:+ start:174 stop:590 length:417 start_codon:yes stop_codon:yes gene_type:complete
MKINIHINCTYKNTAPMCQFSSTNGSIIKTLEQKNNVVLDFNIEKLDTLKIDFINKDDNDDNVVIIKKIIMDDIDLQHFIYHGSFTPRYNPEWFEKQDPKPPTSYSPCTELRHAGVWKMDIHAPIWEMLMKEWLNDKR